MEFMSLGHADLFPDLNEQLQALLTGAFPDVSGDYYGRNLPNRLFLGLDGHRAVAHLAAYKREVRRDGELMEIGMIGGVAVAPSHQRKGIAKHLISMAHDYFRGDRISTALLFAYVPDFYRSSGYEPARFPIRFIEDGDVREFVYRGGMIAYLDGLRWSAVLLDLQGEVV